MNRKTTGGGVAVLEKPNPNGKAKTMRGRSKATAEVPSSKAGRQPVRIRMTLVGTGFMMLDPMSRETLEGLLTKTPKQINKDRSKDEIAGEKLYLDENEALVIPSLNLSAALNHAGRLVPFDPKRKMASSDSSWIPALLDFEEENLPLMIEGRPAKIEAGADWVADMRRGVLQATKVAVAIVRPKFKHWSVPVSVVFDPTDIPAAPSIDAIALLFRLAGRVSGLGSFRPEKKGHFGKFRVENWTVEPLG